MGLPELRYRLSWWHIRAQRETDPWVRFILYYLIFDGYISNMSGQGDDIKKLEWFYKNKNPLRESMGGCSKKLFGHAQYLKSLSPIENMRPNSKGKVEINDVNNVEQIFSFIYQIRCNLFHGSKDRMSSRDSNLVGVSGDYLKTIIDWWFA